MKKWDIYIEPMVKAARTVRRHWQGIINWARKNISNGIIEGFNSFFQATKAKARCDTPLKSDQWFS